jgi:hypothetical protein
MISERRRQAPHQQLVAAAPKEDGTESKTPTAGGAPIERCPCGWPMPCVKAVPVGFCKRGTA